jgi:hypothetical protein
MPLTPPSELPDDTLLELQLRVARRADEIARSQKSFSSESSHCWLLAETEVLERESALLSKGASL